MRSARALFRSRPDPLAEAIETAQLLLTTAGYALGNKVATRLAGLLRNGDPGLRLGFFGWMTTELGPAPDPLRQAVSLYLADPGIGSIAALTAAAEPRRQELLRRLNTAPGGTKLLVELRAALLSLLPTHPELETLDADMRHVLGSWFNRGFLELRRLQWEDEAVILEKLISYEAVHEIKGWDDLHARLTGDRRCYAYFHPGLPGEPLIFIEVALAARPASSMEEILRPVGERPALSTPRSAIFYSISNCQPGLAGIPFGNFLIKQVADEILADLPSIRDFVTLSPIPGFRKWVAQGGPASFARNEPVLGSARSLRRLCASYLTDPHRNRVGVADPVAHFHLSNGAEVDRIQLDADRSQRGLRQSFGLMASYRYRPKSLASNQQAYLSEGKVRLSRPLRLSLASPPSAAKAALRWGSEWVRKAGDQIQSHP